MPITATTIAKTANSSPATQGRRLSQEPNLRKIENNRSSNQPIEPPIIQRPLPERASALFVEQFAIDEGNHIGRLGGRAARYRRRRRATLQKRREPSEIANVT